MVVKVVSVAKAASVEVAEAVRILVAIITALVVETVNV